MPIYLSIASHSQQNQYGGEKRLRGQNDPVMMGGGYSKDAAVQQAPKVEGEILIKNYQVSECGCEREGRKD